MCPTRWRLTFGAHRGQSPGTVRQHLATNGVEIAVHPAVGSVQQPFTGDRRPAVAGPLAGEGQVHAHAHRHAAGQRGLRSVRRPRAGHHQRRAGERAPTEAIDDRRVRAELGTEVVGVDDQQPSVECIPQAFGQLWRVHAGEPN
jgi:hypothetical protein